MGVDSLAPKLETVESILSDYTLPIIVQQRSGNKLLLYKSQRIPAIICQKLGEKDNSDTDEYFLLPLNNEGYFSAVTRDDESSVPYTTLRHLLHHHKQGGKVLLGKPVNVRKFITQNKRPVPDSILVTGETIILPERNRCPKLAKQSNQVSLCRCIKPAQETVDTAICTVDSDRHIHIDLDTHGAFYYVSEDARDQLNNGEVYSIKDIAQHQHLPRMISCISYKSCSGDEETIPKVFRMLKIISNVVVFSYRLSVDNRPQITDEVQLSGYSKELFAIAESAVINTDDIKKAPSRIAVTKVQPGVTLSYEDYYDITRKSSNLPPRLPSRPQSMRLGHSKAYCRSLSEDVNTVTTNLRHSQTVRLPSRSLSQKSLAQRFSTLVKPRTSSRRSVKTILDDFHAKQHRDNEKFHSKPKAHTKGIRSLEISGPILSGSKQEEVIDLCKFGEKTDSVSPEDVISTYSSSTVSDKSTGEMNHTDAQPKYEINDIAIVVTKNETISSSRSNSTANQRSLRTSSISNKSVTISEAPAEMMQTPPARPKILPRSHTSVETASSKPATERMDHVMELKKRFSDIKLKPVQLQNSNTSKSAGRDHMTELKQRLASQAEMNKPTMKNEPVEGDYLSPKPNMSGKIHFHMSNGGEFYQYTQ